MTMKMMKIYLGSRDDERAFRWLVSHLFVNLDEFKVEEHIFLL